MLKTYLEVERRKRKKSKETREFEKAKKQVVLASIQQVSEATLFDINVVVDVIQIYNLIKIFKF